MLSRNLHYPQFRHAAFSGGFLKGLDMPASLLSDLLEPVFQAVFEVGCYYVGRLVVPVVSVGRWKCDRLMKNVPKKKLRLAGLYYRRGQQVYLTAETTALAGMICSFIIVAAGLLWWFYER